MGHSYSSGLLADHAAGRLESRQRSRVEEHLATCPDCREWLETYRLLAVGLAAEPADDHLSSAELAIWASGGEPPTRTATEHVAACWACRYELELLTEAIGSARGAGRAWRPTLTQRPGWLRWATSNRVAAASLILVVLVGSTLLSRQRGAARDGDRRRLGVAFVNERDPSARAIYAAQLEISPDCVVVFEAPEVVLGAGFVVHYGATFVAGSRTSPPQGRRYR